MRRFLVPFGVALLALMSVRQIAVWTSEAWWFAALGQGDTFVRMMLWRCGAFLAFSIVWFLVVGQHTRQTWFYVRRWRDRLALLGTPLHRPDALDQSLVWSTRLATIGGALVAGLAAANRFDIWVLGYFGRSWGEIEPHTRTDLAFYLFTLPAMSWAWNWFGITLIFTACLSIFIYLATETIETGPRYMRTTRGVSGHLAFLGGLIILWLGLKIGLNLLAAPIVDGETILGIYGPFERVFEDSARRFFIVSSLGAALAVWFLNRRDRNGAAFATFTVWMLAALVIPPLAPAFGRSLHLDYYEQELEAVALHLESTRRAWGLENIEIAPLSVPADAFSSTSTHQITNANTEAPSQALWAAAAIRTALHQKLRTDDSVTTSIERVHLERNAQNQLIYRAVKQNRSSTTAAPVTVVETPANGIGDIRLSSSQQVQSVLLHEVGSNNRPTTSNDPQFDPTDLPAPGRWWRTTPDTTNSVARDNIFQRLLLAIRFSQPALLGAGDPASWHLTPSSRVHALMPMPFVDWEKSVARPVVRQVAGQQRLFYLMDGHTISSHYPGSASLSTNNDWRGLNYVRQNLVATLNASTGATNFYVLDENEPLMKAWRAAFPMSVRPATEMPADLRAQLRPSDALLMASALTLERYHPLKNDEAKTWRDTDKKWTLPRSLNQPEQYWRQVTALVDGKARPAIACRFHEPGSYTSYSDVQAIALTFDQGEEFARNGGIPRWKVYATDHAISLPDEIYPATSQQQDLVQTTYWPTIRQNRIVGLTCAQGTATRRKENKQPASPSAPNGQPETTWSLTAKVVSTKEALIEPTNKIAPDKLLQELRVQWRQLREARQRGNWNEVGRLEDSLQSILGLEKATKEQN